MSADRKVFSGAQKRAEHGGTKFLDTNHVIIMKSEISPGHCCFRVDPELKKMEEELQETDDIDGTPPSDIVALNELRSCADLLRMYKADQLDIQPDCQRDVVWSSPMQSRFIDSLVKQL